MKERKPIPGLAALLALSLICEAALPALAYGADGAAAAPILQAAPSMRRERRDLRFKEIARRTFHDYFPGTAANPRAAFDALNPNAGVRSHFEDDIRFMITRMGEKSSVDAAKFQAWWDANKAAVLTPAQIEAWKDMPVETLIAAAYVKFCADESENNQTKFRAMLEKYVDNDWAIWALDGTVGGVMAVAGFVGSSVWNAFTFVIIGDMVRAYSDSLTNTPKQVIGVIGTQHTGWLAAPLSEKGQTYVNYRQKKADEKRRKKEAKRAERARKNGLPTEGEFASADEAARKANAELGAAAERHVALTEAEKQVAELPKALDNLLDPRFLPELTAEQMDHNLAQFNKQWSQTVVAWNSNTLPTAQTGRSVMADGVIFRMKDFARDAGMYENKMELYRQGIEANKRSIAGVKEAERARLEQETLEKLHLAGASDAGGEERRAAMASAIAEKEEKLKRIAEEELRLKGFADAYLAEVDHVADLEFDGKPAAWDKARNIEDELKKLGISEAMLKELKESQVARTVSRRQLVGTFAAQMLHDMMYAELNRKMPDSLQRVLTTMRKQFGFHHFEKMFRDEIHKVLHQAGIEIGKDLAASSKDLAEKAIASKAAVAEVDAMAEALAKATPKGFKGRVKDVADRMYLVRAPKYVVESCAVRFSALGKSGE